MDQEQRGDRIGFLKVRLSEEFGNVGVKTNDDMNPSTPIVAKVTFPSMKTYTFRAWTLNQTKEELANDAIAFVKKQREAGMKGN